MAVTSNHATGFLVGVGVAAAGPYVYNKNKKMINAFLREREHAEKQAETK